MYQPDKYTHSSPSGPARSPHSLMTLVASLSIAAMALAGCSTAPGAQGAGGTGVVNTAVSTETSSFFNTNKVHEISIEAEAQDVEDLLAAYETDQSKKWITATATIDGTTFSNIGLRLKGNSTLRQADTGSNPQELPWQIRLDKYVDGQSYSGRTQFVVRASSTETALNEAVALALLGEAGLATEHAAATRFTFNGSDATLRLVIDNPSDELYSAETFSGEGITYKADSSGDYSYRGANGSDYASAFSVESGAKDLAPVAEFLDFVNNSSDEDFAAKLSEHLDVEQFAAYLAMQDLVANTDDIDGPGNNSYLRYDAASGTMTVVAWDQNLSFGGMGGAMGGPGGGETADGTQPDAAQPDGGAFGADSMLQRFLPDGADVDAAKEQLAQGKLPAGAALPEGMGLSDGTTLLEVLTQLAEGQKPAGLELQDMKAPAEAPEGGAGPASKGNLLVTRFLATEEFSAAVASAKSELSGKLYDSGAAQKILDTWSALLTSQAGDLVDANTVASEAEAIGAYFTGNAAAGNGQAPGHAPQRGPREEDSANESAAPSDATDS